MVKMTVGKLNLPAQIDTKSKACPFCGSPAQVEYWHGGGPDKRHIGCSDPDGICDVAPGVTGESLAEARQRWNRRTP